MDPNAPTPYPSTIDDVITAPDGVNARCIRTRSRLGYFAVLSRDVTLYLLLAVNAHINLDLAIAAVQVAPGSRLPGLARDFDAITLLLNNLIEGVQARIERVSPSFWLLDRVGVGPALNLALFLIRLRKVNEVPAVIRALQM